MQIRKNSGTDEIGRHSPPFPLLGLTQGHGARGSQHHRHPVVTNPAFPTKDHIWRRLAKKQTAVSAMSWLQQELKLRNIVLLDWFYVDVLLLFSDELQTLKGAKRNQKRNNTKQEMQLSKCLPRLKLWSLEGSLKFCSKLLSLWQHNCNKLMNAYLHQNKKHMDGYLEDKCILTDT